jgi:hypothetical protein
MDMGVDQARYDRFASKVYCLATGADEWSQGSVVAHGQDPVACHRHGLSMWAVRIHGVNAAVEQKQVSLHPGITSGEYLYPVTTATL